MAIEETWRAGGYDPEKVESRYVQFDEDGKFRWIECQRLGRRKIRYDVRCGTCRPIDLPVAVTDAAIARRAAGVWPFYVSWPIVTEEAR